MKKKLGIQSLYYTGTYLLDSNQKRSHVMFARVGGRHSSLHLTSILFRILYGFGSGHITNSFGSRSNLPVHYRSGSFYRTSGFWPCVRARALRTPVFFGSSTQLMWHCAPPPPQPIAPSPLLGKFDF